MFPPPVVKKEKKERRSDRRDSNTKEKQKDSAQTSSLDESVDSIFNESSESVASVIKVKVCQNSQWNYNYWELLSISFNHFKCHSLIFPCIFYFRKSQKTLPQTVKQDTAKAARRQVCPLQMPVLPNRRKNRGKRKPPQTQARPKTLGSVETVPFFFQYLCNEVQFVFWF